MRKGLLALGIFLSFVGLGFIAASKLVVKPEPVETDWIDIDKVSSQEPRYVLSVNGSLNQGDKFRVYFQLYPVYGTLSVDASVEVNLTDPNGNSTLYDVPIGRSQGGVLGLLGPFPEGVANYTGTHRVDAEGIWGVSLIYLALQKMPIEEREPQYPYSTFFPVGIGIFLAGGGISLLGAKTSKHKRRLHKHKTRFLFESTVFLNHVSCILFNHSLRCAP